MKIQVRWFEVIGVGACVALLALHFSRGGDDESRGERVAQPAAPASRENDGAELDAKLWDEWRAQREPTLVDSREERRDKEFSNAMKSFRQQPVEVIDESEKATGLVVYGTTEELRALLAAGGSYSGPMPPELAEQSQSDDAANRGAPPRDGNE